MASSLEPSAVVDTVVLRYFLLVERFDLLLTGLGTPLAVPRVVFDPSEQGVPADALSELSQSVRYQEERARDPRLEEAVREQAKSDAVRLGAVRTHHGAGQVITLDMDDEERELFGRLTSARKAADVGLVLGLGTGEAACLAIAISRGLVLVTDDNDALRALERIAPGHPYQRIRKLFRELAASGALTEGEANDIHESMRRVGFWDRESPFTG